MPTDTLSFRDAIRETLRMELARDERIVLIGECIEGDGTWGTTKGLSDLFPGRVRDTPISEAAMVGAALGAALSGLHPIVEIMIGDFLTCCMDELVNQAAKIRYMTGGQTNVPLVVRVTTGQSRSNAAQHSSSLEAWFMHVPGLQIAIPSNAQDASGLLRTAIRGRDPVIFFEYKLLYGVSEPVDLAADPVPFGHSAVRRQGKDLTIVATGRMVRESIAAAEELARDGIEVEVIDPRTLAPLDDMTIFSSVRRTSRALVVEEPWQVASAGAEIAQRISETCFYDLDAPVRRMGAVMAPRPFSPPLERASVPNAEKIGLTVRYMVGRGATPADRVLVHTLSEGPRP